MAARRHGRACAQPPASHRAAPRRAGGEGVDRGRRRSAVRVGPGPGGRGRPGHRFQQFHRRPRQLPPAVRGAGGATTAGVAHALHQFRAQRAGRLLAHRHEVARCIDEPGRLRCELCRRSARSRRAMRGQRSPRAAGGLRRALPRTAAHRAAGGRCVCRGAAAAPCGCRRARAVDTDRASRRRHLHHLLRPQRAGSGAPWHPGCARAAAVAGAGRQQRGRHRDRRAERHGAAGAGWCAG